MSDTPGIPLQQGQSIDPSTLGGSVSVTPPVSVAPAVPATPAQAQWPAAPSIAPSMPSREELLRQAATAPATSFVLPDMLVSQPVAAPVPAPEPTPVVPAPTPTPPVQPIPGPVATVPAAVPVASQATTVLVPAGPTVVHTNRSSAKFIIAATAITLIVVNAAAAGLAYFGYPIPVYTPWISGLGTSGTQVNEQALRYVNARTRYVYKTTLVLSLDRPEGAAKTTESGEDQTGTNQLTGEAQEITDLRVDALIGERSERENSFVQSTVVSVNERPAIRLALQQQSEQVGAASARWLATFPDAEGDAPTVVDAAKLKNTLLGAVLVPESLTTYLATNGTELGTSKIITSTNDVLQRYQFTGIPTALVSKLPTGAALTNVKTQVDYAWETAAPTSFVLLGTLTYQGRSYTYRINAGYTKWDQPLSTSTTDPLDTLSRFTQANPPTDPFAVFVGRLGVRIQALPNTLTASEREN
jgi:hypothetical protein